MTEFLRMVKGFKRENKDSSFSNGQQEGMTRVCLNKYAQTLFPDLQEIGRF